MFSCILNKSDIVVGGCQREVLLVEVGFSFDCYMEYDFADKVLKWHPLITPRQPWDADTGWWHLLHLLLVASRLQVCLRPEQGSWLGTALFWRLWAAVALWKRTCFFFCSRESVLVSTTLEMVGFFVM